MDDYLRARQDRVVELRSIDSLTHLLETALQDASDQRAMKSKAREQRDRVTRLLNRAVDLLVNIQTIYHTDELRTWADCEYDGHIEQLLNAYYKRDPVENEGDK